MHTPQHVRKNTRKTSREATVTKRVRPTGKPQQETIEKVALEPFAGEGVLNPAYVSVSGSTTLPLATGAYVKVQVGISVPCEATEKAMCEAFNKSSEMVEQFIKIELDNAIGEQH